jgi:hypothetical protein
MLNGETLVSIPSNNPKNDIRIAIEHNRNKKEFALQLCTTYSHIFKKVAK